MAVGGGALITPDFSGNSSISGPGLGPGSTLPIDVWRVNTVPNIQGEH